MVAVAVLLSAGYVGMVAHWKKAASFGENNVQANLIRLEAYVHRGEGEVGLVGSSMTARLLPGYFEPLSVDNVAVDGGSAAYGLKLILRKERLAMKVCLIEINTLTRPADGNEALLDEAMAQPQRKMGAWFPILRPAYRPSSVLYSALKLEMDLSAEATAEGPLAVKTPILVRAREGVRSVASPVSLQKAATPEVEEARRMIARLMERGVKVIFFSIPTGGARQPSDPLDPLANLLLKELPGAVFVDLASEFEREGHTPSYTDGIHLTAGSAQYAASVLEKAVIAAGFLPQSPQ